MSQTVVFYVCSCVHIYVGTIGDREFGQVEVGGFTHTPTHTLFQLIRTSFFHFSDVI